ncbi:DUF4148 domain-containing protein [Trinickia sp. NRRL B-1857]|uniref:DUF4148 domain-containing protein n=1 Tax=Trinickia sp. NRRL B-1857 TaxID=3162879 RepID=UPI003D2DBC99
MKSLTRVLTLSAVLIVPAVSFAQSNGPLTRAQVRAELVQLESTGWRPGAGKDPHYPEDIQAAEAKVAAMNAASGYGGSANGSANAGQPHEAQTRAAQTSGDFAQLYRNP